jgi:hypothetical protein
VTGDTAGAGAGVDAPGVNTLSGLAALGNLALSLVLALGLLRLGARRGQREVAALGLYFLAGAFVATLPQLVVYGSLVDPLLRLPVATTSALLGLASLALAIGAAGAYVFTWRRFRPRARWARPLVLVGCGAMGAGLLLEASGPGFTLAALPGAGHWLAWSGRSGALVWTLVEALRWHAALRRRVRLGLVAPVAAHQLLLWAIGATLAVVHFALDPLARLLGVALAGTLEAGVPGAGDGVAAWMAASMLLGAATAGTLLLSFFPPRAYLRWVGLRPRTAAHA